MYVTCKSSMCQVKLVCLQFHVILCSHNEPCEILMIKSRLQSNTIQEFSLLMCETHVESSTLNKIKE